MKIQLCHKFEEIISLDNLLLAWQEFIRGKRNKSDVQIFGRDLVDNILALHEELASKTYGHGDYESFYVNDSKRRHIHKASVRDRLVHHAVYRILYPFFERTFIGDSYSCRIGKGTHKALNRFRALAFQVSKNHTKTCWVLKCDIKKFFASINHIILLRILESYILDKDISWLLQNIVGSYRTHNIELSFSRKRESIPPPSLHIPRSLGRRVVRGGDSVGLPLGNLTSQLFANIYMNVFDQWVKHCLHAKYYIRYADDFIFLADDKAFLESFIPKIRDFLTMRLGLVLHPNKISLKTMVSGVDFLGWVNFANYRILRKNTRRRALARIETHPKPEVLQSYLGLLQHGNTARVRDELLGRYWLWKE